MVRSPIYRPFRERTFARDECFLCGVDLDDDNRSDEHVIPKWVQREFDLWNQKLVLLNATDIPYGQLVIPCCQPCNTGPLSAIESRVYEAWQGGFDSFVALDRDTLFLWLAKIHYGLLVRERFLLVDRRNPDEGPIVEPQVLQELRLHHLLLQAARGVVSWTQNPASIVFVRTKTSTDKGLNFDYADSPIGLCLTLRLGHVGVLAVLQDWGTFEAHRFNAIERVRDHPLAPMQFRELMAFTRYMAHKYRLNPGLLLEGPDDGPQVVRLIGSMAPAAYDPFVGEEYAHVLAFALGVPVEYVMVGDQWVSYLTDDDGQPIDVPFEAAPAPPAAALPTLDDL